MQKRFPCISSIRAFLRYCLKWILHGRGFLSASIRELNLIHDRGYAHYSHICIKVSAVSRCTPSVCELTALQFTELDQWFRISLSRYVLRIVVSLSLCYRSDLNARDAAVTVSAFVMDVKMNIWIRYVSIWHLQTVPMRFNIACIWRFITIFSLRKITILLSQSETS